MNLRAVIKAIRRDLSRAQVRAVDDDGHEISIEVPVELVAGMDGGVLVVSWSIEPASTPTTDEQFQALMGRIQNPAVAAAQPKTVEERIAALLGVKTKS